MDEVLALFNEYVVDPYILGEVASPLQHTSAPWSSSYTLPRQFIVLWFLTYVSAWLVYVIFATLTFRLYFLDDGGPKRSNSAQWKWSNQQLKDEFRVSTWSLAIMAMMTAVTELFMMMNGKIYHSIAEFGWGYFFASPILFLIFTDTLIYWIHRWLHWGPLYKIHKLHHKYKKTTSYSAFHFHPVDGFSQSIPYHLFVYFFPMHNRLYAATLFMVGLWTINIHDRVTFSWFGINGAAHHTVHHEQFYYNYGQYFTFWDRVWGTFKDPKECWPYNGKENPSYIDYRDNLDDTDADVTKKKESEREKEKEKDRELTSLMQKAKENEEEKVNDSAAVPQTIRSRSKKAD